MYPINFELKSRLEKLSILDSYKKFLNSCNFDIQIIIKSNINDISNILNQIELNSKQINNFITDSNIKSNVNKINMTYTDFLKEENFNSRMASKKYFIIISAERNLEEEKNFIKKNVDTKINKEYKKEIIKKMYIDQLREKENVIYLNLTRCCRKIIEIKENEMEEVLNNLIGGNKWSF